MNLPIVIKVKHTDRIDKYLSEHTSFSREDIKKLIQGHAVLYNGTAVRKPNFQVKENQEITITQVLQKEISADPEEINIDIIYEDDDVLVVNKPSGMVVHPAPGHHNGTLVNALLFHLKDLSDINGKLRPGIVHRIDKDTSGLLLVAKNNESHQFLASELKKHNVKRTYLAWVEGKLPNEITHLNLPIGRDPHHRQKMAVQKEHSKAAITHVYVEKILDDKTLVRCELETGRTHQIRVHLAYIKHPVIGDPLYGKAIDEFNQRLHAYKLEFVHPKTKNVLKFEVAPPDKFYD